MTGHFQIHYPQDQLDFLTSLINCSLVENLGTVMTRNSYYQRHLRGYHSHPVNPIPSSDHTEFNKNRKRRKYTTFRHFSTYQAWPIFLAPLLYKLPPQTSPKKEHPATQSLPKEHISEFSEQSTFSFDQVDAAAKLWGPEVSRKPLAMVSSEKWLFHSCVSWWGPPQFEWWIGLPKVAMGWHKTHSCCLLKIWLPFQPRY